MLDKHQDSFEGRAARPHNGKASSNDFMKISDLMPPRVGYLGPRSLAAFLALATLGAVFYFVGLITSGATAKGVGVLFFFGGLVCTAAILLRWLIYREIG